MSDQGLGLFDTPPNRQETRLSLAITALLFGIYLLALPASNIRLPELNAFVPTVSSIIFVGDVIISLLLYAQAAVFRSRALTVLASGFLFIGLLLIPYVLTFPGAFAPNGLLGGDPNSAAWIMIVRRVAFPVVIVLYAIVRRLDDVAQREAYLRRPVRLFAAVAVASLFAIGTTALAVKGGNLLPPIFADRSNPIPLNLLTFNVINIAVIVFAMVVLGRSRQSVLDIWLLVALAGWLIQSTLNLSVDARFTLGWYSLHLIILLSQLVVLVALVAESNRLYARLEVATAERDRERHLRLRSMEAVAAAVSHEVGQPLSVISLNTSTAMNWLARKRPKVDKAIESLQSTAESVRRSFDVMKNVRSVFAAAPGATIAINLNSVVRNAVSLTSDHLTHAKISLELDLDEALPPVMGNQVQVEQVIVNLLTNAIQSLAMKRGRRRLSIRSTLADDQKILLEVSDTGIGIKPESMSQIFKAFHTTKSTGTGIGLTLCRTIIEEHGGLIWASHRDKGGATFHILLPQAA